MGFSGSRRPARASLIEAASASMALSWPNTRRFSSISRFFSTVASSFDTVLAGMRAMVAMVASISGTPITFWRLSSGQQHLRGAGLVDHVDGLVGQLAVGHVAGRQLHRRFDGVIGVADLVELLVVGLEALQDLDGIRDRRLVDVDLLEAADQRAVLLEMLAIFLVGGRADAAQRAVGERRLQQVRGIHGAAGRGARADHRVDFVDEHDGAGPRLDFLHHRLEALLEVAAIARAGQQARPCRADRPCSSAALPALRR